MRFLRRSLTAAVVATVGVLGVAAGPAMAYQLQNPNTGTAYSTGTTVTATLASGSTLDLNAIDAGITNHCTAASLTGTISTNPFSLGNAVASISGSASTFGPTCSPLSPVTGSSTWTLKVISDDGGGQYGLELDNVQVNVGGFPFSGSLVDGTLGGTFKWQNDGCGTGIPSITLNGVGTLVNTSPGLGRGTITGSLCLSAPTPAEIA